MNSAKQVDALVAGWKSQGLSKTEIIINTAESEVGWCYVWGGTGQQCTPSIREKYANRSSCPSGEAELIIKRCQVCNGSKGSCTGCKYFPGGEYTLIDDCQGFIKQTGSRVGLSFKGGGCTSMWNDNSNWASKGSISTLPERLCCVFWTDTQNPKVKSHIGWYIGNGMMIHCSGEVKKEALSKKCTDWAIPKGLGGGDEPVPTWRPTIRKGSTGDDVVYCQRKLMALNYDLSPYFDDGRFGSKTESAVKAFQRASGLNPDGVVGPLTWEKIEESVIPGTGLYTVKIQHLSYEESRELKSAYPDAVVTEEAVTGNG